MRRLTLALTAVIAIAGCGDHKETAAGPAGAGGKRYTIAIVPKLLNNPVFQLAKKGAETEAQRLGDVDILFDSSEKGDPAEQAEKIRGLAQRADALSISVVDRNICKEAIADARAKGKPVMCFDSGAEGAITLYSVNDVELGKELVKQLVDACGGAANMKGEVAILSGQSSAPNLILRIQGATEALKAFPGIRILPVIYCDDSGSKAIEQIRATMQANPKLRGWVMVGGWPLFERNALDSIKDPAQTKVISVDALPQEWPYLESGQVYCLVAQKCFGWGEQSVRVLHDLLTGKKKSSDFGPMIDSGYDLVYKSPSAQQMKQKTDTRGIYGIADYKVQYAKWEKGGQTK